MPIKRQVWAKVLESRQQKGLPYIFFSDTVNKNNHKFIRTNLRINASICVAIMLRLALMNRLLLPFVNESGAV